MAHKQVGTILIDAGLITQEQLEQCLQEIAQTGQTLIHCLVEKKFATGKPIAQALAKHTGLEFVSRLTEQMVDVNLLGKIPLRFFRENGVMPIMLDGSVVILTANPFHFQPIDELNILLGGGVATAIATEKLIMDGINRYYPLGGAKQMIEELEEEKEFEEAVEFEQIEDRDILGMATKKKRDNRYDFFKRALTGVSLGLFFYFSFFHFPPIVFSSALVAALAFIAFIEWPRLFSLSDPKFWLLFPFYPTIGFVSAILLNHDPSYKMLIVFVGIVAYSFDFGSYAVGSAIGKHKLAAIISPRKTWEGAAGGFIFSFVAVYLISLYTGATSTLFMKLFITFCITALALLGDLFESSLKRNAGIKDTGKLLPGHGGLLDRFDSLLLVMPVAYLFKEFFAIVLF